jgi:hypothetical protein
MTRLATITTVLAILAMSGSVLAVEVIDPAFSVETFATYSEAGLGCDRDMTFAGDGSLYVTHRESNTIWKITSDGTATKFVSGSGAQCITWAGGTDFGDNLFVSNGEIWTGKVIKVTLAGVVTNFASFTPPRHCPSPIAVDITGNYGGHLYTATGCQDRTYRIITSGGVSLFADFPGWRDGGGPYDMAFDSTANYAGRMYMSNSYNDCCGNQYISGLWSLTPTGSASRFTEDLAIAGSIAFDHVGDFGGLMFACGNTTYDTGWSIWQIDPDGTATEFAIPLVDRPSLAFGPDGALYVAEYDEATETTVVSRIVAGPPPLLVALQIAGPDEVAENQQTQFSAIAHYDNNSTRDVTDLALWSVEPNTLAAIDENGLLTTESINYLYEDITIYAQYTEDSNTVDAEKPVSIFAVCPTGTALQFDGSNDYAVIPDAEHIRFPAGQSFTIECWYKSDRPYNRRQTLMEKRTYTSASGAMYNLRLDAIPNYKLRDSANNVRGGSALGTYVANQWYHYALVRDAATTEVRLYINAQLGSSLTDNTGDITPTRELALARSFFSGDSDHFEGTIDELRIWNAAIPQANIAANMHNSLDGDEPDLIGYWNFDEGEGQIIYDLSPYANHGQLGSDPNADDSDPAWVDCDAPVGICTADQLIERHVTDALQIKQDILAELDAALTKEHAAFYILQELFINPDNVDLSKRQILMLRQLIHLALQNQQRSEVTLLDSIEKLEDASAVLDGDNNVNAGSAPKRRLQIHGKPAAPAVIAKPPRK